MRCIAGIITAIVILIAVISMMLEWRSQSKLNSILDEREVYLDYKRAELEETRKEYFNDLIPK